MGQFEDVCRKIEERTGHRLQGSGDSRKARCPAHNDDKPSLSVRKDERAGLIGLTCFAGCSFDEVRESLEMETREFRLSSNGRRRHRNTEEDDEPAPAKRSSGKGAPTGDELERYPYVDADGRVLYYNVRFEPKDFRMADSAGKVTNLPRNMKWVPYNLPAVLDAVEQGETIYWVEGERDVATVTAAGAVATTNAGGANRPLDPTWAEYFEGAHVVVVCDRDKPGRSYGRAVAKLLVNVVDRMDIRQAATPQDKTDVTDHLNAGYSLRQLEPVPMRSVRRTRWTVVDIMDTPPEPLRWVLPGVIPEGLTLLVGAPKVGKSWWNINLMVALGSGRPDSVFSWGQRMEPSANLYLALEDPHRRVNSRLRQVSRGIQFPKELAGDVWLDLPPIDEGGKEEIEKWLDAHPQARVVMVDVLAKVRGTPKESQGLYQADYAAVTALKEIADDYGVGVVVTHHDRKKTDEDFVNMVSGTKGVTGAADTILYLTRERGSTEGLLRCESRDVEECQYSMQFDKPTGRWHIMNRDESGADPERPTQTLQDRISQTLLSLGFAQVRDLVRILDSDARSVSTELARGREAGQLSQNQDGSWYVPQKR